MLKWSTGCSERPSFSLHIPAHQNAHSTERGRSERSVEACGRPFIKTLNSSEACSAWHDPVLSSLQMGNLDRRGAELVGVDQEVLPIGYADLVENVRHVMSDRTVANRQLVGDVFV